MLKLEGICLACRPTFSVSFVDNAHNQSFYKQNTDFSLIRAQQLDLFYGSNFNSYMFVECLPSQCLNTYASFNKKCLR